MAAVLLALGALPPAPPAPSLTPAEEMRLAAREIVARADAHAALVVVDVRAPPSAVMDAILDLKARVKEIDGLRGIEVYDERPGTIAARWEAGFTTFDSVFHIVYEYDRANGWCAYHLDDTRPNDIGPVTGSYQVLMTPTGSRLVYRSESQGGKVPGWVRKRAETHSSEQLLAGIRARAEAAK
jgi:hypothetical protein